MAISTSSVWEFRSAATANNVNGGFFVTGASGTDYSQQNAAQYALTGVTSAGAGNVILTASAANAMVGNGIHTVSGTNFTNNSWFEITSVVAGVSITCSTNAAGASISTGVGATGVMNVGGAISLNSTLDDDVFESMAAGNTVWMVGAFTLGETVSVTLAGGTSNPIKVIGYQTTRGDNPTVANRPTISTGAFAFTLGAGWDIYNLNNNGISTPILGTGAGGKIVNCKALNKSTTASRVAITLGSDSTMFDCEAISYLGLGVDLGGAVIGSYIHHCANGIDLPNSNSASTVTNNIISSCKTATISNLTAQTGLSIITGNTLYGAEDKYGIGMNLPTTAVDKFFANNIIYGFVTGVTHADTQTNGYDDYNNYFNNTNDVSAAGQWQKGANDIAVNPSFTNVTQLLGTAGAFAAGGSKLIDTTKDFIALGVTAGIDIIHIRSGTGVTEGMAGIVSISTTTNPNDTLNLNINHGTDVTADKSYSITMGHNFAVGTNLKATGFPGTFQAGLTTGYMDIGAVQRQEPAGGGLLTHSGMTGGMRG